MKQRKQWSDLTQHQKQTGITALIVLVLFIIGSMAIANLGKKDEPKPTGKPQFVTSVESVTAIDQATTQVMFTVKNTGNAAAKPNCSAEVSSPDGQHQGFDTKTYQFPVHPEDEPVTIGMQVTVTGDGAELATKAKVSCE